MDKRETISEEISDIKKEINTYINSKIDLTKLQAAEDLSRFVSGIAVKLVLFYIGLFVLLFVSMAGAFAIGSYTQSNEIGFIAVAGIYFLIAIIFYLLKGKLIQTPVIKSFIQLFFPNFSKYDKE
ncbi:phage holin family protein [Plebeiibacterium marinum]|uniref:Phage holin family protein n=1 Tax=Plebeiibacterium marinum TaxID=2992111 RepID=A0AAE3MGD2_9BACT|nr:phage holin family protein [Plebeiobacterium marinum]MCW3807236.1 phage holin family protein [Plebeiobacterium marinum]